MNTISRTAERGSARLKFLIVIAVIGVIAYAGFLYVPIAYDAYMLKDVMQHNADVAATQGYPASWVKDQLTKGGKEYGVPADAVIDSTQRDNRMEVRVQFVRNIEFPGFTYQYNFDHTARSTPFLTFK